MNILKNLLQSKANLLPLTMEEVDILTYLMCNRQDFESWFAGQAASYPKIKFVFYYPTAIDLYFEAFKLFTIYFKKDNRDEVVFSQAKLSQLNRDSLNSQNWKPFKDVIVSYLMMAQERNTDLQFKRLHALHEYQAICNGEAAPKEFNGQSFFLNMSPMHLSIKESTL